MYLSPTFSILTSESKAALYAESSVSEPAFLKLPLAVAGNSFGAILLSATWSTRPCVGGVVGFVGFSPGVTVGFSPSAGLVDLLNSSLAFVTSNCR